MRLLFPVGNAGTALLSCRQNAGTAITSHCPCLGIAELLALARELSPMTTILRVGLLRRTVVPRVMSHVLTWCVLGVYAAAAAAARLGVLEYTEKGDGGIENVGTVVTFTVIFYVGYCETAQGHSNGRAVSEPCSIVLHHTFALAMCSRPGYTRYNEQFDAAQLAMRSIVAIVTSCRVNFDDAEMVDRLYRYINLSHAACYVGLTDTYTVDNFFKPVCHKHHLFAKEGSASRRREAMAIERVSLDGEGSRAWSMFHLWALEVINEEFRRGALSAPLHAQLTGQMHVVADAMNTLYAFIYQVLPFIHTT